MTSALSANTSAFHRDRCILLKELRLILGNPVVCISRQKNPFCKMKLIICIADTSMSVTKYYKNMHQDQSAKQHLIMKSSGYGWVAMLQFFNGSALQNCTCSMLLRTHLCSNTSVYRKGRKWWMFLLGGEGRGGDIIFLPWSHLSPCQQYTVYSRYTFRIVKWFKASQISQMYFPS